MSTLCPFYGHFLVCHFTRRISFRAASFTLLQVLADRFPGVALRRSPSVMLYRSKIARVRWPEIFIATVSTTPARFIFRTAERLRSWKIRPPSPARSQASPPAVQAVRYRTLAGSVKHELAAGRAGLLLKLQPAQHVAQNRQLARFAVLGLSCPSNRITPLQNPPAPTGFSQFALTRPDMIGADEQRFELKTGLLEQLLVLLRLEEIPGARGLR